MNGLKDPYSPARKSASASSRRYAADSAIHVLFLGANPLSTERLEIDEELRAIKKKIRAARHRIAIRLTSRDAVRPHDLQEALLDVRPHVVHFSCHGDQSRQILLADGRGDTKPVGEDALVSLFRVLKDNIRVVMLNACFSDKQAEAVTQYVDCAIGMSEQMPDADAIVFSAAFYQGLGFHRSVEEAFELAKGALLLEGSPRSAKIPRIVLGPGVNAARIWLTGGMREAGDPLPVRSAPSDLQRPVLRSGEPCSCGEGDGARAPAPVELTPPSAPLSNGGATAVASRSPAPAAPPRKGPLTVAELPGGTFVIGTNPSVFRRIAGELAIEYPLQRPILSRLSCERRIAAFKLSVCCVTNAEYWQFVREKGYRWPTHWERRLLPGKAAPFPERLADVPVVNVTPEDVHEFCLWAGGRLPTAEEWERAASGGARRLYPWGDTFDEGLCVSAGGGHADPQPVSSHGRGDSVDGVRQLCGNVREWVIGPSGQLELRGGSFRLPCRVWGLTFAFQVAPDRCATEDVGFRVAFDFVNGRGLAT
jgi:formylglycine-generating enzyme required for sulfatase activity